MTVKMIAGPAGTHPGDPVKVEFDPFQPWPGSPYICSPDDRIDAFARVLKRWLRLTGSRSPWA